jgi:hypothetical protein
VRRVLLILALILALRLPFLDQAIQGDDYYYLKGAEHALTDPLHPLHARYLFQGEMVDMRGHPHPPGNAWTLAALLALAGDVREIPFHAAYIVFSLIAALAMLALADRFSRRPLAATLLFCAVPAFVINGNSLESDVPFLAFWMAAIALFVRGGVAASAAAGAAAGLFAYQAVLLTPVLGVYLWLHRSRDARAWAATLAAPAAILAWQLFERLSGGALPAAQLAAYLGPLQYFTQKLRNAGALTAHLGWVVFPALSIAAFRKSARWAVILAIAAGLVGTALDTHPLFWVSFAAGVLVLAAAAALRKTEPFLAGWILIFFAAALVLFFAGSARYLLPLGAPVAILVADRIPPRWLAAGTAAQLAVALSLAAVNFHHWDAYRAFARHFPEGGPRVWVTGEWGLRHYLEANGALPLGNRQRIAPGELVVASELAFSRDFAARVDGVRVPVRRLEVTSPVPLRLIALGGRSAYSVAAAGLRPFDLAAGPIDRVTAEHIVERRPVREDLTLSDPAAFDQVLEGIYPDGWSGASATVILKPAEAPLRAVVFVPEAATVRELTLAANGAVVARLAIDKPGMYTISGGAPSSTAPVTATLRVDRTFRVPPDVRDLGVLVRQIGFGR